MITQDKRRRSDGRKSRVLHVPLTDKEFAALRSLSFRNDETLGDLASYAVRSKYDLDGAQKAKRKLQGVAS